MHDWYIGVRGNTYLIGACVCSISSGKRHTHAHHCSGPKH